MAAEWTTARGAEWTTARGAEWLEADGAGGFASGGADGIRTRRYHALLLTQTARGRYVLVNGIEAWVELAGGVTAGGVKAGGVTAGGTVAISSQLYAPDVVYPDARTGITGFTHEPWPCWTFALPDGSAVVQEVFVAGGQTSLRWTRVLNGVDGAGAARLQVRLLVSGRDYHALHHENPAFDFGAESGPGWQCFRPYAGLPPIVVHGGAWRAEPVWYRRFLYTEERARGLDDVEDLASPGVLSWDLDRPATLALRADRAPAWPVGILAEAERAERMAQPPLQRAARQYLARAEGRSTMLVGQDRGTMLGGQDRSTILAGFPWFTDWGRDTFISVRGLLLCRPAGDGLATRARLAQEARAEANRVEAEAILVAWAGHVSEGMLPNRFPDAGGAPEYNSVDASLWFVIAVGELLQAGTAAAGTAAGAADTLRGACGAILSGYRQGTRYGIGMDADGLIRAGAPGVQLTWMDAKVGDWVVTPRRGKPVEIQALWINALRIVAGWDAGWGAVAEQATASLLARFVDPATGGLFDLVDGDGDEGRRVRPNQIFAVGGLPHAVVPPGVARGIVDLVEARLLTPLGLRTLDPGDAAYQPRYAGGPLQRDGAYHQGTAWPWLLGPFVEAWLRVRDHAPDAIIQARARFLPALHAHLGVAGLGHVSEVVDGAAPHVPGGCPFQAWSLGELLRVEAMLG